MVEGSNERYVKWDDIQSVEGTIPVTRLCEISKYDRSSKDEIVNASRNPENRL